MAKKTSIWTAILLSTALFMASGCGTPNQAPPKPGGLQPGDKAGDFSLLDSEGRTVTLANAKQGWYLVLFFYRGYWCSACLNQLLNLKQDYPKFTALHAAVVGVSTDSVEDSNHFNQQWRFPFPLLSDPRLRLIDAYGARHPEGHEGKDIAHPAVIIIDPNRAIRYKYVGKYATDRPEDDEILYTLQQLEKDFPPAQ